MKKEKKTEAISLRKRGQSITGIARRLGVSRSSVSLWVRDIKLSKEKRDALKKNSARNQRKAAEAVGQKYASIRSAYRTEGYELASKNEDFRILSTIYWGEGRKSVNSFILTNSDVSMLGLAAKIIAKYSSKPIKLAVSVYLNNDLTAEDVSNYWAENINIDKSSIVLYSLDEVQDGRGKNRGKLPYGTASINVYSVELIQKIYGGIDYLKNLQL